MIYVVMFSVLKKARKMAKKANEKYVALPKFKYF